MDSGGKVIRIVIIESSEVVRNGLVSALSDKPEFRIAAAVDELSRCRERMSVLKPDIVMMNPSLVDMRGNASLRSMFPEFADVTLVAFVYGLFGEQILRQYDGVASIYDSGSQIVRKIKKAMEHQGAAPQTESYELSDREREILVSVAHGLTNKEIADLHHISIYTVITHRKNITRKTGIKSVAGLTVYALLNNIIDQSDMQ